MNLSSNQIQTKNPVKRFFLNDKIILLLITLNALVIFLQGFDRKISADWIHVFVVADDIISVLFIFEVLVKSQHFGFREYIRSNWNKFDVLLILLSIPSILVHVFHIENDVGFLLVFRVFRVFKFFRFIQFFPQVEHIFRSVQDAMRASFMVLVGFFVCAFIMGIVSCFFYKDMGPVGAKYFGDPIVAFYTTFQIFTVEGWNMIPEELCANMSPVAAFFTKAYFISLLILGGVFGLSIVNSLFVDAMVSDNNDELEQQVAHIEEEVDGLKRKIDRILAIVEKKYGPTESPKDQDNSSSPPDDTPSTD